MNFFFKKNVQLFFCLIFFHLLILYYRLPILGLWEGAVIYNILDPERLPFMLPTIQQGADSVGFHGVMYFGLSLARYFVDFFGYSISNLKFLPILYATLSILILHIVIRRWFGKDAALFSTLLLCTNKYFLVQSQEIVAAGSILILIFLLIIERFQKLQKNLSYWNILTFSLIISFALTNYIIIRFFAIFTLLYIFFFLKEKKLIFNKIFYLKKNKNFILLLKIIICSLLIIFIFNPINIFYLFNKNFIFPMTGEYINNYDIINIINIIFYNIKYLIRNFILENQINFYAYNLTVEIPSLIEKKIIIFITFLGIILCLKKIKNYNYFYILTSFFFLIFLILFSNRAVENENSYNMGLVTSINHYRVFIIIPYLYFFFSLTFIYLREKLSKNYFIIIKSLFLIFIIFRLIDVFLEKNHFNNFINNFKINFNIPALQKKNPPNDGGTVRKIFTFSDRLSFHYNQIYFYKLSELIKKNVQKYEKDVLIIRINPDYYTPDYYRMDGGIPSKDDKYYLKIYLKLYLGERGIPIYFLVKNGDYKKNFFSKVVSSIDDSDHLRKILLSKKIDGERSEFFISIFIHLNEYKYTKKIITYLTNNSLIENSIKIGEYSIHNNFNKEKQKYIIVTNENEFYEVKKYFNKQKIKILALEKI